MKKIYIWTPTFGNGAKKFASLEKVYNFQNTCESASGQTWEVDACEFKKLYNRAKGAFVKNPIEWSLNGMRKNDRLNGTETVKAFI